MLAFDWVGGLELYGMREDIRCRGFEDWGDM
jgi:hypothetical protein